MELRNFACLNYSYELYLLVMVNYNIYALIVFHKIFGVFYYCKNVDKGHQEIHTHCYIDYISTFRLNL